MPYIIDGNNLLGLPRDLRRKDPGARTRLLRQVAAFARARRTRVTVVFDGEPDAALPSSDMSLGAIRVLFAGRTSDADGRILKLLAQADDPAGITLVTSDRALADRARHLRARLVNSLRFRRALDELPEPGGEGPGRLSASEVEDWEAWFRGEES